MLYQTRRLLPLVASGPLVADTGPLLLRWLDAFFYYEIQHNAFPSVAGEVYRAFHRLPAVILEESPSDRDRSLALDAAVRIALWGRRRDARAWRNNIAAIERVADDEAAPRSLQRNAALHLATAPDDATTVRARARAARALRRYLTTPSDQTGPIGRTSTWIRGSELVSALVDAYAAHRRARARCLIQGFDCTATLLHRVQSPLDVCVEEGLHDIAAELARRGFQPLRSSFDLRRERWALLQRDVDLLSRCSLEYRHSIHLLPCGPLQ